MVAPRSRPGPNMRRRAYVRPWYVTATDIAHRCTVLALVGGTLYYTAFTFRMLYLNHKYRKADGEERKRMDEMRNAQQLPEPVKEATE
ncbi:hypothetical protein BZA70DRAFT_272615 [Myxozyma melibiosi]|uniref:Cytochrome c oxidase assembly protein COX14 n=1 Tax=Myxozyma melibiosi TaxID=54550 RepID=A0ABR1FDP3_9ASCO